MVGIKNPILSVLRALIKKIWAMNGYSMVIEQALNGSKVYRKYVLCFTVQDGHT